MTSGDRYTLKRQPCVEDSSVMGEMGTRARRALHGTSSSGREQGHIKGTTGQSADNCEDGTKIKENTALHGTPAGGGSGTAQRGLVSRGDGARDCLIGSSIQCTGERDK